MSLHIFSRRALPQWSSLAQLQTDMATGSYGRRGQALYQVGKEGDDSSVIGQWRYDGTVVRPIGPIDLTAAAWGYATVAGVVGAAVTVDAGPTLGTSGTLRAWDVSAGASLGDVAYTRSGTAVTLTAGALAGLAAGDVLYEVVGGRTGALDVAAAGEIRPAAGASVQPRATGLRWGGGDVFLHLWTGLTNVGCPATFWSVMTVPTPPSVDGQAVGVGLYASADTSTNGVIQQNVVGVQSCNVVSRSRVYGPTHYRTLGGDTITGAGIGYARYGGWSLYFTPRVKLAGGGDERASTLFSKSIVAPTAVHLISDATPAGIMTSIEIFGGAP